MGDIRGYLGDLASRIADGTALRVYLAMVAAANEHGQWRGTRDQLAQRLGVSPRSVSRAWADLQREGYMAGDTRHRVTLPNLARLGLPDPLL